MIQDHFDHGCIKDSNKSCIGMDSSFFVFLFFLIHYDSSDPDPVSPKATTIRVTHKVM